MFTVCQELKSNTNYEKYFDSSTNVDTHMMKNVEWGATVYLAHSKYGLNGNEVRINTNTSYITGMGSGSTSSKESASNAYNTVIGKESSTTNNIYGIYDMSGGAWDEVSACYEGYTNILTDNTEDAYIEKYIDIYSNYSISKYGDALYETSDVNSGNWFGDHRARINSTYPLYVRGGWLGYGSNTGAFAYWYQNGNRQLSATFRPTIAVTDDSTKDIIQNIPEGWVVADKSNTGNDWYAYRDTSSVSGAVAEVNSPKLASGMTPIKYVGEEDTSDQDLATLTSGSRWANAMTKDGSMWVWIPRYAYRITSGYHQSGADINPSAPAQGAGTIEIAFLDTQNNFLDPNITGTVVTNRSRCFNICRHIPMDFRACI